MRDPVRAILGDLDPENPAGPRYLDSAIDRVMKACVTLSRPPGYALTQDGLGITPALNATNLALLTYEGCSMFLAPQLARYQFTTRALEERVGDQLNFFQHLQDLIMDLKAGGGQKIFTAPVDFASWVASITGMNLWTRLTDLSVTAPVLSLDVSRSGVRTISGTMP